MLAHPGDVWISQSKTVPSETQLLLAEQRTRINNRIGQGLALRTPVCPKSGTFLRHYRQGVDVLLRITHDIQQFGMADRFTQQVTLDLVALVII